MKKLFAIIFVCVLLVFVCSCTVVDKEKYTLIPMVMVNGELYLDTGHTDNEIKKCGTFDGEILSSVDPGEKPAKNDQSNFGKGYGYRYTSTKGVIEICMDSKWRIFATEEQRQKIQFENKSGEVVLKEPPSLLFPAITPLLLQQEARPRGCIKTVTERSPVLSQTASIRCRQKSL